MTNLNISKLDNEEDKEWLEKCIENVNSYAIHISDDEIWVTSTDKKGEPVYSFKSSSQEMLVKILMTSGADVSLY